MRKLVVLGILLGVFLCAGIVFAQCCAETTEAGGNKTRGCPCLCLLWPLYQEESGDWVYYAEDHPWTSDCCDYSEILYETHSWFDTYPQLCDNCEPRKGRSLKNPGLAKKYGYGDDFKRIMKEQQKTGANVAANNPAEAKTTVTFECALRLKRNNVDKGIPVKASQLLIEPQRKGRPAKLIWVGNQVEDDTSFPTQATPVLQRAEGLPLGANQFQRISFATLDASGNTVHEGWNTGLRARLNMPGLSGLQDVVIFLYK